MNVKFDIYNAMFNFRVPLNDIKNAALDQWTTGVWTETTSSIPQYHYGSVFSVQGVDILRLDWAIDRPVTRVTSLNLEGEAVEAWMRQHFNRQYHVMFIRTLVMLDVPILDLQNAINEQYVGCSVQRRVKSEVWYYQKQCGKPPYKLQVRAVSPTQCSLTIELYITCPGIRKELSDMTAEQSMLQMRDVSEILARLGVVPTPEASATYLVPSIRPIAKPAVGEVWHNMVASYRNHLIALHDTLGGDWAAVGEALGEMCETLHEQDLEVDKEKAQLRKLVYRR